MITNATTYDGNWDFYIRVGQGNTYFSLWDGDFDLSNVNNAYTRSPSVYSNVLLPDGTTSYTNLDPSGNREWEEFRLDTTTSSTALTDYYVPTIPAGLWTIQARGVDLHNLNALRFEYPILGVDADGKPAEPEFPYALGDRVWLDANRDGIQGSSETSITGAIELESR
ncbi:MAG: hypothetical protein Q7V14_01100, partial [Coriobacteriia bacterium]|nr:hypothetical protein [Coriobacteriia bacterium]